MSILAPPEPSAEEMHRTHRRSSRKLGRTETAGGRMWWIAIVVTRPRSGCCDCRWLGAALVTAEVVQGRRNVHGPSGGSGSQSQERGSSRNSAGRPNRSLIVGRSSRTEGVGIDVPQSMDRRCRGHANLRGHPPPTVFIGPVKDLYRSRCVLRVYQSCSRTGHLRVDGYALMSR